MNKFDYYFKRFLVINAAVFTGSLINSLLIANTNSWKLSLCIILASLSLNEYLKPPQNE